MEIKIDRYTKAILTLIAVGLFLNAYSGAGSPVAAVLDPAPAFADNVGMGSTLSGGTQPGQRFITASPDGKTVYFWFREEDKQWYDRDKIMYLGSETVSE